MRETKSTVMVIFSVGFLFLFTVSLTFGAGIIYVDTNNGNDSWPGDNPTSPVKTIQKGVNVVDAGGNVYVMAGTYSESVQITSPVNLITSYTATISPSSGAAILIKPSAGVPLEGVGIGGFTLTGSTGISIDENMLFPSGDLILGDMTVSDCDFNANTWSGFAVSNGAEITTLTLQGCSFQNNTDGISATSSSQIDNMLIKDCTISGNSNQGMYFVSCTLTNFTIQDTDISATNNPPIKIDGGNISNGLITGGSISGSAYGIDLRGCSNTSNLALHKVEISNHSLYGILVICGTLDAFTLENCSFTNNKNHVYMLGSSTYGNLNVTDLMFIGNDFGSLSGGGTIDIDIGNLVSFGAGDMNMHLNHFEGLSTKTGVNNSQSTNVDATNNWWGDSTGPAGVGPGGGAGVTTNVDYEPWSYFGGVYEAGIGTEGGIVNLDSGINDRYTEHSVDIAGLTNSAWIRMVPPADRHGINNAVEVILEPGTTVNGSATITVEFSIPDDRVGGYTWEQMRLARWTGSQWEFVPGSTSNWPASNTVSGLVTSFSIFGAVPDENTVPVELSVFTLE